MSNKLVFTVKGENDTDLELAVVRPDYKKMRESEKYYNAAWNDAWKAGAPIRAEANELLKKRGLWSDEKSLRVLELQESLREKEKNFKGGVKLEDAKLAAFEMRRLRMELYRLLSDQFTLDHVTAESQAESAKTDYLVSVCTVYSDGKPYFEDLDDYYARRNDESTVTAIYKYSVLVGETDPNVFKEMTENKFLKQYGFINDDLKLVDKEGNLVDEEGRRVDEEGRLINEDGKFVDHDGNLVDENGEMVFEQIPFLD